MTDVTLVNRALRQAKLDTIDSLDDENEVAAYCKGNLPLVITEGLTEHDWGFARKRVVLLQLVGIDYSSWDYIYDMPDDMIQPQHFVPHDVDHRDYELTEEQYEVFENSETADRASGRVGCNEEELDLVYTKMMSVVPHFPYYFAEALTYLLGYHLASTFGGTERANQALTIWIQEKLPWAIGKDNNRKRNNVKGESSLTTDYGYLYDPYGYSRWS